MGGKHVRKFLDPLKTYSRGLNDFKQMKYFSV